MKIGIPTEVKVLEGRVGLIPAAAGELVCDGHTVFIQKGAGILSGYSDEQYIERGVQCLDDAQTLYGTAELVVKVKEPQASEYPLLRKDHLLFCFLHLAAEPALTQALLDIGLTAIAFETVEKNGKLPLLAPMSDIAGRLATQIGSNLLHQRVGGKGLLLGGLPATDRGHVVILGGGVAGLNAASQAAAIGAEVVVFDPLRERLSQLRALGDNVTALYPYQELIAREVRRADLLIGAVLLTGQKAPHLVDKAMVRSMDAGSVIIDIAVDQGGCIETTQPTDYETPTFIWEGVVHFGVTNMPGTVPRSASQALSAAIISYTQRLAEGSWRDNDALIKGINVAGGKLVHPALKV